MAIATEIEAPDSAVEAARAVLAARQAVVERRLEAARRRRAERAAKGYPISLPYQYLTPAQQAQRKETADDLVTSIGDWIKLPWLPGNHRTFLDGLRNKLWVSRGRYAMSPGEWDTVWTIRDYVLPPEDEV